MAPEDETNMLRSSSGSIRAASLGKLISHLTSGLDPPFLKDFLMTYRTFIQDGRELLNSLVCKWQIAEGENPKLDRLRVFNVIKTWISHFWWDFQLDCPKLGEIVLFWLDGVTKDPNSGGGKSLSGNALLAVALTKMLTTKLSGSLRVIDSSAKSRAQVAPKTMSPIVRHFTLLDWSLWRLLQPYEFLNLAWMKPEGSIKSVNVLAIIIRFELITSWVTTKILRLEKVKERAKKTKTVKYKTIKEKGTMGKYYGTIKSSIK